jgi:2-polyprenyl-3-methyl-5-hydroxy-6-metoxy-1,4-benzoquinol methylase
MTHVLEHLDNPIEILKRINNEWLTEGGKVFIACPNANAPSRQIAVKMGIISHNSAITESEKEHGHKITYSLDTLQRDVRESGLKILQIGGIFFNGFSNFQWDKILKNDIVSKEFIDGCFQLGKHYPDLCASIYVVCKKGDYNEI